MTPEEKILIQTGGYNLDAEILKDCRNQLNEQTQASTANAILESNARKTMSENIKKPLIVSINGVDGIGKETISGILNLALSAKGHHCYLVHTPFYDSFWGDVIKRSLHGEWGDPAGLDPYNASTLYRMDRVAWMEKHKQFFTPEGGYDVIIFDSNWRRSIIHQGVKILSRWYDPNHPGYMFSGNDAVEEVRRYIGWLYKTEVLTTPLNGLTELPFYLTRDASCEDIVRANYQQMAKSREDVDELESNLEYQLFCARWGSMVTRCPNLYLNDYHYNGFDPELRSIESFIEVYVDYISENAEPELKDKLIWQAGQRAANQMVRYVDLMLRPDEDE